MIGICSDAFDRPPLDEQADCDRLPERKEEDALDAEELWGRSEGSNASHQGDRASAEDSKR